MATRSHRGSSSSIPPTADGFEARTPVPSPQSQSFSRGYGSVLSTSLAYIVPLARGCSPWRPDAVMSTTGRGRLFTQGLAEFFSGNFGRRKISPAAAHHHRPPGDGKTMPPAAYGGCAHTSLA
ncbi:hypothetical protein FH972_015146 [Carpinus fangiana]|uniref:Uncharacterized protein n=1 Tax=Carpinus fangiana TaxID=176857 RepID=A0A5N6RCG1_9ROSI|nr:hypothetical protein FH972_015146 [Carpinus fangiana]